ncbi:helix-turn-helix domain-containing protein [Dysgonomonas capnocytophagoides]|uniref:helix-turn-helix domain-containing protein n=1 Tax=Dysgonomonas capnocytophagoides TaxID=45254 RepID=UPI00333F074B
MENVIVQGASMDDLIKRITSNVIGEIKPLLVGEEKKENKRLSRREAADWLRISERTLDKLSKGGSIRFIRIGGRVMYEEIDLTNYLNANKTK